MNTILKISKEQIPTFRWPQNDVLLNTFDRNIRKEKLRRALVLGNTEKIKASIHFLNREGEEMVVETTIWALTEVYVCLKHGITLPIRAITHVEI